MSGVNDREPGAVVVAFANSGCSDSGCSADWSDLRGVLHSLVEAGAIDRETEQRLLKAYGDAPEGRRAVERITRFRTVVHRALATLSDGNDLPADVLDEINAALDACGCVRKLVRDGDGYRLTTLFEVNKPEDVLMPLADSLVQIVTTVQPGRVKQCREPRCSCYFVDTSKNRTRAWCSMERCGNRQKVANYYRRGKERAQ